jgi:hypothetical protein
MRNISKIEQKKSKIRNLVIDYITASSGFEAVDSNEMYYDFDCLVYDVTTLNNKYVRDHVESIIGYSIKIPAWAFEAVKAGSLMAQARVSKK